MRRRLQEVAVRLFQERGFERTTAAEIAAGAGVTERTFFRHFPDKRDIFFNEAELHDRAQAAIAAAPGELEPLDVVHWAFRSFGALIEANRPFTEPGREVIARTPALQERQLTKTAATTAVIVAALERRGVEGRIAALAAAIGMAAAATALNTWFEDPAFGVADHIDRAFSLVRMLAAPSCGSERR